MVSPQFRTPVALYWMIIFAKHRFSAYRFPSSNQALGTGIWSIFWAEFLVYEWLELVRGRICKYRMYTNSNSYEYNNHDVTRGGWARVGELQISEF